MESLKPYVRENSKENIDLLNKLAYIMSSRSEEFDFDDDRLDDINEASPEMLKIADCLAE